MTLMAKNLVIVESPAKARTIEKILGKDFNVMASLGHVRDLPQYRFGVNVSEDFAPSYEVPKNKKDTVQKLAKAAKSAEAVYLATDPDREGEAISWHLLEASNIKGKPVRRIVFHEITKTAITEAFDNPREIDMDLVDAQQARRVLDRVVGYRLSPLLWRKLEKASPQAESSPPPSAWYPIGSRRSPPSSRRSTGRSRPTLISKRPQRRTHSKPCSTTRKANAARFP